MSKGLDALKYLKENKRRHWLDNDKSTESLDIIEKELKALEIIILKNVDIRHIKWVATLEGYNMDKDNSDKLTREEYDLINEVFKNE